tara:strand:+ start:1852 stop:2037 length:186 start_codon:yes stop_codon:yes gene_type:complete
MDIRFLIVGTPFVIAFFYTLFWLKKWGAFNSSIDSHPKKMITRNDLTKEKLIIENIFLTKD